MKQFLLVFLGGGLGSMARYAISKVLNNNLEQAIPYGTLLVNILGSLFIGLILGIAVKNNNLNTNQTLFLATGFCGGFTTFSTFTYENYNFLKVGDYFHFGMYTTLSFALGLSAVFFGFYIAKLL